jgi:hypothetical protein
LKLCFVEPLSNLAFKIDLRRYKEEELLVLLIALQARAYTRSQFSST